jgi:hypothetical protein
LIASAIPWVLFRIHHMEDSIERFRIGGAILPSHWLFLKWCNEISANVCFVLMFAFALSFWRPSLRKEFFGVAIAIAAACHALYASYCILLISKMM